jgi:hypothetical protein
VSDRDEPIDPVEVAAKRTMEAEQQFVETPTDSGRLTDEALTVEQRAEELHDLAADEAEPTDS